MMSSIGAGLTFFTSGFDDDDVLLAGGDIHESIIVDGPRSPVLSQPSGILTGSLLRILCSSQKTLGPMTCSSPSSSVRTPMPGPGLPTEPTRFAFCQLTIIGAAVSVIPYPQ